MQGKAATLHELAYICQKQEQVQQALDFYYQALELQESIGNVKSKAATIQAVADTYMQQGQFQQAIGFYHQAMELQESIGDVKGRAVTLANMGYLAGQLADYEKELHLYLQAATLLAQIHAYPILITVLGNLASCGTDNALVYLAQAVWLAIRVDISISKRISPISSLFNEISRGDSIEPLLGTTALFFCMNQESKEPELQQLQETSLKMLIIAAPNGIDSQEAFEQWIAETNLNEPAVFLPQLNEKLEALVGDRWLFDREAFSQSE